MTPYPDLTAVTSPPALTDKAPSPYAFQLPLGKDFNLTTELTAKASLSPEDISLDRPSSDVRMSDRPRISIVLSQERVSAACGIKQS